MTAVVQPKRTLLQSLQARLEKSTSMFNALHLSVMREQANVIKLVDEQLLRLDGAIEQRALAEVAAVRDRVLALARANQLDRLTTREARAALRMMGALHPNDVAKVLKLRPELMRVYVEEIFRSWDDVNRLALRSLYAQLAVNAPNVFPFMALVARGELLRPEGAHPIASRAPRTTLAHIAEWLRAQGLKTRWAFTAQVLTLLLAWMLDEQDFGAVWQQLAKEPDLAKAILPPLQRPGGRWFFPAVPSTKAGSTVARSMFVAAILNLFYQRKKALPESIQTALLDSDLGDPRMLPESFGWQTVRKHAPEPYARFLEDLVREDLTLFFDHAMNDQSRRKFWLRYIKSIRRTVCVLGRSTFDQLTSKLTASSNEVKASLSRVKQFSSSASVSAFCLYFDHIVVVEFSDTGNAAYVYQRTAFDSHFEARLLKGKIRNEKDLKDAMLRIDDIKHFRGWETRADELLGFHGVRR